MPLTRSRFLTGDGNSAPDYVKNGNFTINQDSPQARALKFWHAINTPAIARDLVSGVTAAHNHGVVPGPFGNLVMDSETSTSQTSWPNNVSDTRSLTKLTISMRAITTSQGGNKNMLMKANEDAYRIRDNDSTYKLIMGNCTEIVASSPTSQDGVARLHVGRLDGANVEYFIDGKSVGTASDAVALPSANRALRIGTFGATAEGLKFWDVRENHAALTDAECFALFDELWDLYLETGRRKRFSVPAAEVAAAAAGPILQFDPKWQTRYTIG